MYLRAGEQKQLAVGDYRLAWRHTFGDDRFAADGTGYGDGPGFDGLVRFHHEDELAALHRFGRHHRGVALSIQREDHVDELAGPEHTIGVVEDRFEPDGARVGVHRVVDDLQHAARNAVRFGVGGGLYRQTRPRALPDRTELLLRNAERHENRRDLVDDH